MLLFAIMPLIGCESLNIKTQPRETAKLELQLPKPLELENVKWKLLSMDGTTYYAVTSKGYEALSRNTEQVQNRIIYLQNLTTEQKFFYEQ